MTTTNYFNTFIEVAEDCNATGEIPPIRAKGKSVANYEYEIISQHPYQFTSDDVIFQVYAERNALPESEWLAQRELFFAKGRACFRASPLTKTYGWGIHCDHAGKMALIALGSSEYRDFLADNSIFKTKAMRSKKEL